jgi:ribosomal protein L37AE/L43A
MPLPGIIVQDQVPEITVTIPDTKRPALMKPVKNPTLRYHTQRGIGRGAFQPAEYDLAEMGRIEDTDSYVRQAFSKKTALMFKESWDLIGPNRRTIKYIKTRLAQISAATGISTNTLFREIGSAIVRKSNAFLIKVRKTEASGGKLRRVPGSNTPLQPVAGYFIAPAETMEFELRGNRIGRWRQKMPNGDIKYYSVKDVIHISYDRKEGFVFGTPTLIPVIDDIRALRKIEENVEMLIYQHIFPLFQYIVGTPEMPAGITESGEREIDVVRKEIMYMPTEGGIVTPERHEVKAIGAEGRALRAEGYLEHFKKRVFSGLGVSAVDMGEGETANRATADNMSRNMVDSVKDLQQVLEDAITEFIINELLLESTFGDSVLDDENRVKLKFKEIDIDAKIKKEAHATDMFAKDILTHDETRRTVGLEPLLLPTPEESQNEQDGPDQYPEWNRMRWTMFERPKLLIQSVDEPYSMSAKAAAKDSSISMSENDIDEVGKAKNEQEIALEKERTKAKVAVAKAKPKPPTKKVRDNLLETNFREIKSEVVSRAKETGQLDHDWTAQLIRTSLEPTKRKLVADALVAFRDGYIAVGGDMGNQLVPVMSNARTEIRSRIEYYVTKLANQVVASLQRNTDDNMTQVELANKSRAVFDSMQYRTSFIEDVEIRKAAVLGKVAGYASRGVTAVYSIVNGESPCSTCISRHNQAVFAHLGSSNVLPPHHANCSCGVSVQKSETEYLIENSVIEDTTGSFTAPGGAEQVKTAVQQERPNTRAPKGQNIDDPPEELIASGTATECPKCGKTATRVKGTDSFNCKACSNTFSTETEDAYLKLGGAHSKVSNIGSKKSQRRRCISKYKASLKANDPTMDEATLDALAEAACNFLLDAEVEEEFEDGTLEECVLSVKKNLRKEHPDWSADKIKSSAFAICNSRMKGKK